MPVKPPLFDFERIADAEEWAHHTSLIYDTDEECQEECERLLKTIRIRDRDEKDECEAAVEDGREGADCLPTEF